MDAKPTVNIITLGCAKNLVDSEYLSMQLAHNGYLVHHENNSPCDVTIINTCGFINDAKQESIETILEYVQTKEQGYTSRIYVMGCLSQRYRDELTREMPEVDGFFGVYDHHEILSALKGKYRKEAGYQRQLATPEHYAYLKVAEGCNRRCSFCSIPLIKGNYHSRPVAELEKEAQFLAGKGVKEINLIAQDLSYYGVDLTQKPMLHDLLEKLDGLGAFSWIRMLYAYPAGFPTEVLDLMKGSSHICNYLDIPVQHISDRMLRKMRRGHSRRQTYQILNLIRKKLPEVTLRTTLLVGHPGEGDREFSELLEFVRETQFDRLGVFTYSEEEGTHSARTEKDDIPEKVKQERANEIMQLQQEISYRKNRQKVGKTLKVIIDHADDDYFYGRGEADAPEVDNGVLISQRDHPGLQVGAFYETTITEATDFDLYGKVM